MRQSAVGPPRAVIAQGRLSRPLQRRIDTRPTTAAASAAAARQKRNQTEKNHRRGDTKYRPAKLAVTHDIGHE
jgi:hypothetical protein